MKNVEIQLFGALREAEPTGRASLSTDAPTIGALRAELAANVPHWPEQARALLRQSAFASDERVLRDADTLPADGRLALLPPVSGG